MKNFLLITLILSSNFIKSAEKKLTKIESVNVNTKGKNVEGTGVNAGAGNYEVESIKTTATDGSKSTGMALKVDGKRKTKVSVQQVCVNASGNSFSCGLQITLDSMANQHAPVVQKQDFNELINEAEGLIQEIRDLNSYRSNSRYIEQFLKEAYELMQKEQDHDVKAIQLEMYNEVSQRFQTLKIQITQSSRAR